MFGKWYRDSEWFGLPHSKIVWILFLPGIYFGLVVVTTHLLYRLGIPLDSVVFKLVHLGGLLGILTGLIWLAREYGFKDFSEWLFGLKRNDSIGGMVLLIIPVITGSVFWWMTYQGLYKPSITPPHNHDAANHVFMVRQILENKTLDYSRIFSYSSIPSGYPMGMHVFIASVLGSLGIKNLLDSVYPLVLIMGSFFPWAVFVLAEAIGLRRNLAAGASFLILTMFLFPFNVLSWGGWGMLMGITLLTYALAMMAYWMKDSSRFKLVILWVFLISIFLTHTSELFSFTLLTIALLIVYPVDFNGLRKNASLGLLLLGLSVFIAWPFLWQGFSRIQLDELTKHQPHYPLGAMWTYIELYFLKINSNYLLNFLAIVGIIGSFKKTHLKILALFFITIFLVWIIRFTTPVLDTVFLKTYPWLEHERIAYLFAIPYSLAAAYGLKVLVDKLTSYWQRGQTPWIYNSMYWVILVGSSIPILLHSYKNLEVFIRNYSATTSEDIRLMRTTAPECDFYITDVQDDAGRWIPYVTGKKTLFEGSPELYPDYQNRLDLLQAIQTETRADEWEVFKTDYPFDCIFYGNKRILEHKARLNLARLLSNNRLEIVAQEGTGYVLRPITEPSVHDTQQTNPLRIEVVERANFLRRTGGGVGDLKTDRAGSAYSLVSTVFDIWFKEAFELVTIEAQSAITGDLSCDVYINGTLESSVVITQNLQEVLVAEIEPKYGQKHVRLVCPANNERALQAITAVEDSKKIQVLGPHFAITAIGFK